MTATMPTDPQTHLTVPELAEALGFSVHRTRRLLQRGLVPGAFKIDPGLSRSHYYIPGDAAERFRAQGDR
jgi:hypothetical protein